MQKTMIARLLPAALLALAAAAAEKVTFGTNWLAQAEHGGYYQAVADGTYAKIYRTWFKSEPPVLPKP